MGSGVKTVGVSNSDIGMIVVLRQVEVREIELGSRRIRIRCYTTTPEMWSISKVECTLNSELV